MASTYTTRLRLEKQADGENSSTWGQKANTVFDLVDAAIAGRAAVTHDDSASYTLTANNGSSDEARCMILNIGGALTAARNVVCPTQSKFYVIKNATTGGYAITLKTSGGTGISVPNGKTAILMCDGTNVVSALDYLASLTFASLGVASSGSGAYDMQIVNTENLTANRELTIKLNDAARTLDLAGNLTTSGSNALTFTTTGDTNVTLPTTGTLATLAGAEAFSNKRFSDAVFINDSANANMTYGVTIKSTGAADDSEVIALKNDVTHGVTGVTETDTFAAFAALDSNGGLEIIGINASSESGIKMQAVQATTDTQKSTLASAAFVLQGNKTNGTAVQGVGGNANLVAVKDWTTTRFILDADGDSHQDVGTAWTNFDHLDDVATLDALSFHVARADDPIKRKFGEWMEEKRDILERQRLVTFNDDGHHFVNMSRLTMLLTGAVRQIGEQMRRIEERQLALESRA